jgi:RNA polymerase sigma factor (TIGR02999 family)
MAFDLVVAPHSVAKLLLRRSATKRGKPRTGRRATGAGVTEALLVCQWGYLVGFGLEGSCMAEPGEVTRLLQELTAGRTGAIDDLLPLVYDELRRIAARHMRREGEAHTLQPTALVHEAYLKLVGQTRAQWDGRTHFLCVASSAMRRILVDHARGRLRHKRGAELQRVDLDDVLEHEASSDADLLDVHEALERLAALDERQARVVELRFFGGLTVDEAAAALGVSRRTIEGEWTHAKAWLSLELGGPGAR